VHVPDSGPLDVWRADGTECFSLHSKGLGSALELARSAHQLPPAPARA
jgi:hypothetical protein